ncbi:MAG TPA: DUF2911 domain-containing protein [Chitinophagaceae bacterium]|nr:DUF2911 domain-containing protein [Chitinophagaceae bacterium]
MKLLPAIALVLLCSCTGEGEQQKPITTNTPKKDTALPTTEGPANPYTPVDRSPMDIVYFPVDFPIRKMAEKDAQLVARVIYSRPHRQGRTIFGSLLKWGEPWRLGANEATEIELFRPVTIQNRRVPKGRYILYCIPYPDRWTVVFNSNTFSWGLKPDTRLDVFRFDIPSAKSAANAEYFTMQFFDAPGGGTLLMAWDEVSAQLHFTL